MTIVPRPQRPASWWARYGAIIWGCCTACLARPASFSDPARAAALSDSLSPGATTVPIQLVRGVLIGVPAEVEGHRGLFFLDTGSPLLMVNSAHLQGGPAGTLDTVVATDRAASGGGWVATAVTVRIGTLTIPVTAETSTPMVAVTTDFSWHEQHIGQQFLGLIGPAVLAHYETVIDYSRRQLTLIPVDTMGHRLVAVPRYTPQRVIPIFLREESNIQIGGTQHWFLDAMLGGRRDTVEIDTGNDINMLSATTATPLAGHLTPTGQTQETDGETTRGVRLDRLTIAGQPYPDVLFYAGHQRETCLGSAFFRDRGVVGLNFRARQLLFYNGSVGR